MPLAHIATRLITVAAILGAAAPALAAPPKGPPPGAGGERSPDDLRREVLERLRAMRAWKLSESLRLDDATAAKLFPLLSRYDEQELALMKERRDTMRALRAEIEAPKADNGRVSSYVDKLLAFRAKQRILEDDKVKELRKILSPVQQAKLIMLLPRIDSHFQQRIREAVEARRRMRDDDPFSF